MKHAHKTAGTSTVEATILLPVFILLLFGVTYVGQMVMARLDSAELSRRCVTLYAKKGCGGAKLPPECSGLIHKVDAAPKASASELDQSRESEGVRYVEGKLSLLSDVLDALFGEGRLATVSTDSNAQDQVGLSSARVRASTFALCNSTPVDSSNVAETLFNSF